MKQKQNKATQSDAAVAISQAKAKIAQIRTKSLKQSLDNMIGRLGTDSDNLNLDAVVAMAKQIERLAEMVLEWERKETLERDEKKRSSAVVMINEIDYSHARAQLEKAIAEMEQEQKSRLKNKNNFK